MFTLLEHHGPEFQRKCEFKQLCGHDQIKNFPKSKIIEDTSINKQLNTILGL